MKASLNDLPLSEIADAAGILVVGLDTEGRITYFSPRCSEVTGYACDEVLGRPTWEVLVPDEERGCAKERFAGLIGAQGPDRTRGTWVGKDGERRIVAWSSGPLRGRDGSNNSVLSVGVEVAPGGLATEPAARASEFYHALVDHALEIITVLDAEGVIRFENPSVERILGYRPEELVGRNAFELIHPDDVAAVLEVFRRAEQETGKIDTAAFRFRHADESWRFLEVAGKNLLADPAVGGVIISSRDVTERKQAELEVRRINRVLAMVRDCNALLVRATDEEALLDDLCELIVADETYALAWVGYAENADGQPVTPMCIHGPASDYARGITVTWNDAPTGQGPVGRTIRMGEPVVIGSLADEPSFAPWRARAGEHGLASVAAFCLKTSNQVFGALSVYSTKVNAFDAGEIAVLAELAADLGYGIDTIRERRTRREAQARQLELAKERDRALLGTIEAIALAAEARDPYTAGHERRVAALARAIAEEMGLPPDQCEGIKIAATIHDIGKLNVPMEILARPSLLTEPEYVLVQQHVNSGYRILKGVDFPWPVSTVVLQHHERMDGSGYPAGLKGEEILLEARVVAVADVIEAMATHRPYRPSRGVDAALLHVLQNRGTHFDPTVVDACIRVFKERGFQFEPVDASLLV